MTRRILALLCALFTITTIGCADDPRVFDHDGEPIGETALEATYSNINARETVLTEVIDVASGDYGVFELAAVAHRDGSGDVEMVGLSLDLFPAQKPISFLLVDARFDVDGTSLIVEGKGLGSTELTWVTWKSGNITVP